MQPGADQEDHGADRRSAGTSGAAENKKTTLPKSSSQSGPSKHSVAALRNSLKNNIVWLSAALLLSWLGNLDSSLLPVRITVAIAAAFATLIVAFSFFIFISKLLDLGIKNIRFAVFSSRDFYSLAALATISWVLLALTSIFMRESYNAEQFSITSFVSLAYIVSLLLVVMETISSTKR